MITLSRFRSDKLGSVRRWGAKQLNHVLILICGIFLLNLFSTNVSEAQEVRKTIRDYLSGPVSYSPDDPWYRSRLFNQHTGHYGRFYNCDGEECKRYSPYIDWKTNCDPLWPDRIGFVKGFRLERYQVAQRRDDGGCGCKRLPADMSTNYRFRRAAEFLSTDQYRIQPSDDATIYDRGLAPDQE